MEPGDPPVFQFLDPFCQFEDSIAEGNEEVGHSPVVFDVPIGGSLEYVFIVFDAVVEPTDLFFEVANFAGFLGVALGDSGEEPLCNGSEDVGVEVRVGCQGGRNGTGRHRWFWALDQTDRERVVVFGG
jgi:hypothetical protein